MQVTLPNGEIFTTEQLTAAMDNWYRNGVSLNDPRVLDFFNYAGLSNEFFAQAAANTAYEKNQSAQEAEKAEAARLEAERAEAARLEAARVAALPKYTTSVGSTYTTDDVRNLLNFFDSVKIPLTDPQAQSVLSLLPESFVQLVRPTYKAPEPPAPTTGIANDLMYRSMTSGVSSSLFDKYGGYEKVKAASTLGATPKDIADYERAMGLPESEYTRVNKEYAASGKSKDTIISEITALIPTSGSITYETLVNYANKNNLSFQSVANALEGKFKNVTPAQILSNLNYEDDRLILNSLAKKQTVNGKEISSVDLSDAIIAASQGKVTPENLAKFFGKTPTEMASLVSSNLDFIADKLRDNGIEPSKSLSSMFGVAAEKVVESIKTTDIKEGLNALAGTDGKIGFDAAIKYASEKGLSNDQLASYLGVTPKAITDYVTDKNIRSGLNAAAGTDEKISYDEALDFAGNNDITIEQLASYLGVAPKVLSDYDTSRQIKTGIERVAGQDNQLSFLDIIGFAETNKLNLEDVVNHIGNPSTKDKLLSDLKAYKSDLASGKTPTNQLVYTTEGLADAYQLVSNMSPAAQKLAALAQNALQNPTIENKKALYSAYKTNVTSDDLNQAEQYIAKLTGGNATITNLASSYMFDPNINVPEVVKEPVTLDQGTSTNQYKYISEHISDVLKNPNATVSQKVDYINQFAAENNLSRQELSAITGYSLQDVNDFLDAKPVEQQQSKVVTDLIALADKDGRIGLDTALNYASENNVKIEELATLINVPLETLTKYKTDTAIISGLEAASGEDKQLSYSEIVDFASKNNMDLSNVVNYIGTEDKRSDLLTSLQDYVKEEGFKTSLSDTKLTDYKGNQYAANDLLKLADQVKQNFDTENSSGGVYKTSGESVGFDYSEAKKLFPEGKNPTVFDQVALDIARGLLKAGIKDVSELSKYKPTEVTELDYNVEAGPPVEYKVTKLINPETGEEAPNLGATYTGKGGTVYNFTVDASGKPVFGTAFTDTSDKGQIATLVAFGAAILAPQILPQLIGAAPAAVAGVEGAVAQAALGGTGLTGSLMAAGVPASVAGYAATAIVNGVYNGVVAEATGGDFEKAFITGGVAPVIGQLTTNAVNSITTGLPAGVSNAVGNAVSQLISTGEIDLGQVALAGARPAVINTIVNASGGSLTVPQARLLLDTVASGGKNITSLAQNPAGVVNFVLKNQDAFKSLSTAAATNTAQKPPNLDLSSLDTVQKEVLTSQPRTETIQGEALFQDINTTELGTDLAKTGIVRPPGEIISTDLSKPVTGVDEFARYDDAIKFAQALISGDPSALAKMAGTAGEDTGVGQLVGTDAIAQIREAQRTGALDYYNLSQAQLEAMLIDRAPTLEKAREMAELAYGKGASFSYGGKFYEGTQQTTTQTPQAVQIKDSSGKVFDVPANATLNKNSSGAIVGYTHNGTTYEYQNGKMVPLASTALPEKYTLEDVRKLSLDGLTKLYESIDPNAHKQTTIPGTGQVVTPYQAWLVKYGKNPEAAVAELNATAPVKDASVLQIISKNIGNVVQELRSSDNSYVRSVGDKLATNATYLGEAVKGAATTLSSPVELFNAIAFGDPKNPISQWASGVRSDITAAQAAVDPGWQKTKSFINEQLTKIGADQGQIAQFVAGADLYANNPRALGDFFWNTVPTAIPGVAAYSALTRFGVPIAYAAGAITSATGSQTDLVSMADATYQNLYEQVKRDNPNISERDAQERAAAGTAVSMRAAGLISLAGSTAIQLLPGTQAGGVLARAVTREIGQEVGDESWVKVLSNAWQGKDLQTDMGRTVLEAVLASGPISTAANLLTNQYGTTYNQDQVVRDLNWELENATPTFNQGVKVLTGPNNQPILNSSNQPILLTYDQKPGLTFDEDPNKSGPSPTELNKSGPTESIFDVVFDNEQNGGYTVNSVSLDGNSYTITDKDGNTKVLNTNELLNNALNIVTQQDPGAYQSLVSNDPLEALISDRIARTIDLDAINQNNQLGNIISTNQNGAFAITDSGSIAFVPNKIGGVDTKIDFKIGDSVVIGQGLALPVQKEVTAGGQVTFKPDSSLDLGVTFGPIFSEVQTNTGTALVNTTAPNVSTGTVVSIDPSTQTALVSTNTGNPFLVNLFGYNPNIGSNLFFNATTGDVIGAPLVQPPVVDINKPPVVDINQPPAAPSYDVANPQTVDTSSVNTSVSPPSTDLPPVVAPPIIVDTVPPPTQPPVVPPTITPPVTDLPPTIPPPTITPPGVEVPTVNVPTGSVPTSAPSIPTVKPPVTPPVITTPPIITTTTQPEPWDLPVVPPPELSGSFQMPYPNYLRPLDPYLGYGIGALMGDLYDEVSRDGRYQPFQNAQGEIKIPT